MFDPTSRYAGLPIATTTVTDATGAPREIAYVRRRFIPSSEGQPVLLEHTVAEGDRLDTITARYLGDPTQSWRICDANGVFRPQELTARPGRTIVIVLGSSV
jgi:hypothetical protein